MRTQLLKHTVDHAHVADELTAALGLPEDFDGDRFDRVSRTHVAQCRTARFKPVAQRQVYDDRIACSDPRIAQKNRQSAVAPTNPKMS